MSSAAFTRGHFRHAIRVPLAAALWAAGLWAAGLWLPAAALGQEKLASVVASSEYSCRFDGEQLVDGKAVLSIGSPLRPHHSLALSPLSLTVTSQSRAGAAPDGRWWAVSDDDGRIRMDWRQAAAELSDDAIAFDIDLPVTAQCRFELTAPSTFQPNVADAIIELIDEDDAGWRRWRLELGAKNSFRLTLVPEMPAAQMPSFASETQVRMSVGRVDVETRVRLARPLRSNRLTIKTSNDLTLLSATIDERECEIAVISEENAGRQYSVQLPDSLDMSRVKSREIRLVGIGPAPRTPTWSPPRFVPTGLLWDSESLTIVTDPAISVTPSKLTGAAHLRTQSTIEGGLEMDFRLFVENATVRVRVEQRPPELLFDVVTSMRLAEDAVLGRVDAEVRSLWGEVFTLELPSQRPWLIHKVETIPPDLLEGGGGAWEVDNDRLTLTFSRPISPQRSVRLIVEGRRQILRNRRVLSGNQLQLLQFPAVPHIRHRFALSASSPNRLRLSNDVHLDRVGGGVSETERERILSSAADLFVRAGPGLDATTFTTESSPDEVAAEMNLRVDIDGTKLVEVYHCRVVPTTRPLQTITFEFSARRQNAVEWFVDGSPGTAQRLISDDQTTTSEQWSVNLQQKEVKPIVVIGRRESVFNGESLALALAFVHQANLRGFVTVHSTSPVEFEHLGMSRIPVVTANAGIPDKRGEFEYSVQAPMPRLAVQLADAASKEPLAWALQNRVISELSPDGRMLHIADLFIESNGRREVRLTLPPTAVPLELRVDGESMPLVLRDERHVICPLPGRYLTTQVRVIYRSFGGTYQFVSEDKRPFLVPDFPSPQPHWYLAIPDELNVWDASESAGEAMLHRLLGPFADDHADRRDACTELLESTLRDFCDKSPEGMWYEFFNAIDQGVASQWGGRLRVDRNGLGETGLQSTDIVNPLGKRSLTDWLHSESLAFALLDDDSLLVTSRLGMATRHGSEGQPGGSHHELIGVVRSTDAADVLADRWGELPPSAYTFSMPQISRQRAIFDMDTMNRMDKLVVYNQTQMKQAGWGVLLIAMGVTGWGLRRRSPLIWMAAICFGAAFALLLPCELAPIGAGLFMGIVLGGLIARLTSDVHLRPSIAAGRSALALLFLVGGLPTLANAQVETESAPLVSMPRPQWHISTATYRWLSDAEPPRLIAEYEIDRVSDAGVISIPFNQDRMTVLLASQDGRSVGFHWAKSGGLLLYLTKAGKSRLQIEVIVESKDGRTYQCPIPRVARSAFRNEGKKGSYLLGNLSVAAPPSSVDRASDALTKPITADPDQLPTGEGWLDLGPRSQLRLVRQSSTIPPMIRAISYLRLRSESLVVESRFEIVPAATGVEQLQFDVPPSLRLVTTAIDKRVGQLLPQNGAEGQRDVGSGRYSLRFSETKREAFTIDLTFHIRDRNGTGRIAIPAVKWREVDVRRRTIAIDFPTDIEIVAAAETWDEVEPSAVTALWQPQEMDARRAFATDGVEPLVLFSKLLQSDLTANEEIVMSIGANSATIRYGAEVFPEGKVVSLLQLQAPRGFEIGHLTVVEDNVEFLARYAQAPNGMVTVFLPDPTLRPHRVQISGQLQLGRATEQQKLNRIRLLGGKKTRSTIRVYRRANVGYLEFQPPVSWELAETAAPGDVPVVDESPWNWELGRLVRTFRVDTTASEAADADRPESPLGLRVVEPRPNVEGTATIRVVRQQDGWTASCDLRVSRADDDLTETDLLRLEIPAQWQAPFRISPAARWEVREHETGRRILVIIPDLALRGDFQYRVEGQWSESERAHTVPNIIPLDLEIGSRFVVLPRRVEQQQVEWQVSNLLAAKANDLPEGGTAEDQRNLVYRTGERSFEATLGRIQAPSGFPLVRLADVRLSLDAANQFHGTVFWDIEPSGDLSELYVGIPSGVVVDAVQIGNSLSVPAVVSGRVQLSLHSPNLPQRVELRFHGEWDPLTDRLAIPQVIQIFVARTIWTVTGRRRLQNLRHDYPDAVLTSADQRLERILAIHSTLEMSRDRLLAVEPLHAHVYYRGWLSRMATEHHALMTELTDDADQRYLQLAAIIESQESLATLLNAHNVWSENFGPDAILPRPARVVNGNEADTAPGGATVWRLGFSGSRPSLTLDTVTLAPTHHARWATAFALTLLGVLALLARGQLESLLAGQIPAATALSISVAGLAWGALLQPVAFAAVLIVASLLLTRPRTWAADGRFSFGRRK
jgi:hypothetical protein